MENYNLIIAGVIGSTITLLLTAIFDFLKEKYRAKIEMKKLVFQMRWKELSHGIKKLLIAIE